MLMATHVRFLDAMENLQRNLHQSSKDHGFWEGPENNNIPTKLMLIVSEVAEAMEEHRDYGLGSELFHEVRYSGDGEITQFEQKRDSSGKPLLKPEGFAIEMADVVIRVMDLCERLGINLADAILIKADYNKHRPMKHGEKAY